MRAQYEELTLSKRSVAAQQIDAAVELILSGSECVPAHTLTWAALKILRGVARGRQLDTLDDAFILRIKPAHLREFHAHIKRHYNFFKHADRDADEITTDFRPESTIWTLFICCHD